MTNSIVVNSKNRTIELTKKFEAAAKYFGTQEYEKLQTVRSHYPNYFVVVKAAAKKADHYKGLTFDYMEKYITAHNKDLLVTFFTLCGNVEISDQFFGWICGFGNRAKITDPFWVKHQFTEYIDKIKSIY